MSKTGEYFRELEELHPSGPEGGPAEDEDSLSNCCGAPFGPPGWPDCDICSDCGEHSDVGEE